MKRRCSNLHSRYFYSRVKNKDLGISEYLTHRVPSRSFHKHLTYLQVTRQSRHTNHRHSSTQTDGSPFETVFSIPTLVLNFLPKRSVRLPPQRTTFFIVHVYVPPNSFVPLLIFYALVQYFPPHCP